MDNDRFIKTYDNMLYSVAEGIETLADQVILTSRHRPSVLSSYAVIGLFTARVYTAIAMAERYLDLRLWLNNPARLKEDELNLGMLFNYFRQKTIESRLDDIWNAISSPSPDKHFDKQLASIEHILAVSLSQSSGPRFIDHIPNLLTDLLSAVNQIYNAEHHGENFSKLEVNVRSTGFVSPPAITTDPLSLMLQQAYAISGFSSLFRNNLHIYTSWPLAASQLLVFVCDMEETLRIAHSSNLHLFMSDNDFLEAAECLRGDGYDSFSEEMDTLSSQFQTLCSDLTGDLDKIIRQSIFPLYSISDNATALCWPYVALLKKLLPLYRQMVDNYFIIVEHLD